MGRWKGSTGDADGEIAGRPDHVQGEALTDNAAVRGIVKAPLTDIKDNSFIGVTGMPQSDGSQKAVEIHIFPEPMRGTGEGHRTWDLLPNSTMTNATVAAQSVKGVNGKEITLKYKDGEKKILVVPETVIVTYVPGYKNELKPGCDFADAVLAVIARLFDVQASYVC